MRKSLLFPALCLLTASVEAFKERGAAERYAYFLSYVAEEVFTDSSKWTIAKGCVGTRTGMRGQKNRCDLIDFCNHLWAETTDEKGNKDKYVAKDKQVWPSEKKIRGGVDFGLQETVSWIMGVKQKDDTGKAKKIAGPGFTGMINGENLYGKKENWFLMVSEFPERLKEPQKELTRLMNLPDDDPNALTQEQKDSLKKVFTEKIPNSGKYIQELRLQDRNINWIKPKSKKFKAFSEVFGHEVVIEKRRIDPKILDGKVVEYEVIDRMKTADKVKGDFGNDIAKAIDAFDTTVKNINDKDLGFDGKPKAHQRAMDAWEIFEDNSRQVASRC
ncbi:hypothetical protein GQ53DRAFT_822240 [Thozetella sp. PMI_491]|nr:hypothetical protein GQ53DRAFT_822240 [Thozetella sp. PMI_491]